MTGDELLGCCYACICKRMDDASCIDTLPPTSHMYIEEGKVK